MNTLPTNSAKNNKALEALANILDSAFPIPGTRWRIGLDPLLGLIPGLGDVLPNILSLLIVLEASRRGVSNVVLVRMLGNVLIDSALGVIPIIGDLFDFGWKANQKNMKILSTATTGQQAGEVTAVKRVVRLGIIIFIILLVAAAALVSWLLFELLKNVDL